MTETHNPAIQYGGEFRVMAFEPGDGTRYRVVFGQISPEEARTCFWGSRPACFFGFSADGGSTVGNTLPMDVAPDFGYFVQRVAISHEWTANAAYHAYCALIGDKPINPSLTVDELRWKPCWFVQLNGGGL